MSRRNNLSVAAAVLGGLLSAEAAWSAGLIGADPWEVIHVAREHGEAEVGRDTLGDPEITVEADGIAYAIAFYGCTLGRDCADIHFVARFERDSWEPDPETAAEWNAEKLFGRAFVVGEAMALDFAVPLQPGVPKETLQHVFTVWHTAYGEFVDYIDFKE